MSVKTSFWKPTQLPGFSAGSESPPKHLKAKGVSSGAERWVLFSDTANERLQASCCFFKPFSFSALVVRSVHTRAVFSGTRQEAEERLLPGEQQLVFHRRKGIPDLEEATGILDWEPKAQIIRGQHKGINMCICACVFLLKDMDR